MIPKTGPPRQAFSSVTETEIIVNTSGASGENNSQSSVDSYLQPNGQHVKFCYKEEKKDIPKADDRTFAGVTVGSSDFLDLEAFTAVLQSRTPGSAQDTPDPNLVAWEGVDDPENPKNWNSRRKWAAALVVSSFTFITPVASAIVAPAFSAIKAEFQVCFPLAIQVHIVETIRCSSHILTSRPKDKLRT